MKSKKNVFLQKKRIMAKKINLFSGEEVYYNQFYGENMLEVIRAAINGDKKAKVKALKFLDLIENTNNIYDYFDNIMNEDVDEFHSPFPSNGYPLVLKRKDVKEYHVRIKLNNTTFKIWREVKVPSNITLHTLAKMLLEIMGWDMEHLFGFRHQGIYYSSKEQIEQSMFPLKDKDYSQYTLSDLITEKGKRMKLDYDYGDSWEHDVWVKGIREYEKDEKASISFVSGHGCCPPDNCGGVCGYEDLVQLTYKKKPTKREREELEWYCMDSESHFDPDYCDEDDCIDIADEYNDMLQNS